MVWVIAFSSPDSLVISSISLCDQNYFHLSKFVYRDYSYCQDNVNRAAGLRTAAMVFAEPLRQFYRDGTTRGLLPGFSHLDKFTVTRNLHPSTGTLQKPCQRLTQTATPHTTEPLAAMPQTTCIPNSFDYN